MAALTTTITTTRLVLFRTLKRSHNIRVDDATRSHVSLDNGQTFYAKKEKFNFMLVRILEGLTINNTLYKLNVKKNE